MLIQFFPERSVTLIDIQVIIFMKVISNVEVRVTIQINIRCVYAEPISDDRTVNARFFSDIGEFIIAFIFEQPVAGKSVCNCESVFPRSESSILMNRMIEQIH